MPRDNPRDTRFAINFFTSIGLGALTEDLRAHLKNAPKPTAIVAPMVRGTYSYSFMSSLCNQSLFYNPTIEKPEGKSQSKVQIIVKSIKGKGQSL